MNKRLLMLSGLAILAMAINHATNSGFIAMFWWTDRYRAVTVPNYDQMGSLSYFFLVSLQKLTIFCVPAFLFTTGMFLAYAARGGQSLNWGVIKRRVLNLLPPYLIWTLVFFGIQFFLDQRLAPLEYIWRFISIENSPFFFIPLVIVYYLISPFLVRFAKANAKVFLLIASVILLMGIIRGYLNMYIHSNQLQGSAIATIAPYFRQDKIFEYFFYYALGIVVGFNQVQFKTWISRFKWPLLILCISMGLLAIVEAEWVFRLLEVNWRSRTMTLPSALYSISFFMTFLAFDQVQLPFSKFFYNLGEGTLAIYLIHKSVLLIAPKLAYHFLPFILGYQIIYIPFLVSLAIGIPVLIMTITRRLPIRIYYRYLFG